MYNRAFAAFRGNFPLFFIFAVMMTVLDELDLGTSFTGAQLVLTAFLAFYCHRMILTGECYAWSELTRTRWSENPAPKFGPFFWRFMLFALVFLVLLLFIYWMLRDFKVIPKDYPDSIYLTFLLSALVAFPFYGVFLALFGTVFPAAAINKNYSLEVAYERGKKTFWRTLWRLFIGNVCFTAAVVTVVVWISNHVGPAPGSISYYIVSFLTSVTSCFSALLAATALSMAYLEIEDVPSN